MYFSAMLGTSREGLRSIMEKMVFFLGSIPKVTVTIMICSIDELSHRSVILQKHSPPSLSCSISIHDQQFRSLSWDEDRPSNCNSFLIGKVRVLKFNFN
jgi:hypothetical protein